MKKTYIAPRVRVNKIGATQMMCASPDGFNGVLNTEGVSGDAALGKIRGTRTFEDDDDDLW